MLTPDNLLQTILDNIETGGSLLVLGIGEGRYELEFGAQSIFGIDICDKKLEKCKHKAMVAKMDVRNLDIFLDKSFDTVSMIDLIEHFTKDDAIKILRGIERIVRKQIILFVPVQSELVDDVNKLKNMQEDCIIRGDDAGYHLSLWKEEFFQRLGYKTIYSPEFHGTFGAFLAIKKMDDIALNK